MGYIKNDFQKKKRNDTSTIYTLFFVAMIFRFFGFFMSQLPFFLNLAALIAFAITGGLGLLLFILNTQSNLQANRGFYIWIFLMIYIVFIGMLRTQFYTDTTLFDSSFFAFQDITYLLTFAIGAAFANKQGLVYFHKMMVFFSVIAVICGILALLTFNYTESFIYARKGNVWTISYYLWWPLITVYAYMFSYSRITGKNKILAYSVFSLYILLGIMFQKRSAIVTAVFLFFILAFIKPIKLKNKLFAFSSKLIILLSSVLILFVVFNILSTIPYFREVTNAITDRFELLTKDEDARVDESDSFFQEAEPDEIILGEGAGCFKVTSVRQINAMHIGFVNAIYKGGILYLAFYAWIILKTIKLLLMRKKLNNFALISICVTLTYLLNSCFDMGWGYTMLIIGYATSITYILQYSEETNKELIV